MSPLVNLINMTNLGYTFFFVAVLIGTSGLLASFLKRRWPGIAVALRGHSLPLARPSRARAARRNWSSSSRRSNYSRVARLARSGENWSPGS